MITYCFDINEKYLCTVHNDGNPIVGDFIHLPLTTLPDDKKDFKYLKVKLILYNYANTETQRSIYGKIVDFKEIKKLLKI